MKKSKNNITIVFLIILFFTSFVLNIFQYQKTQKHISIKNLNERDDIVMKNIELYLDTISIDFISSVNYISSLNKLPSWGCGPSSFALIKILNNKFFENKLVVSASYTNTPYEIVERFGFADETKNGVTSVVDHAWIEIYFKNKMLFVDPTIGQFGKYNKIVYKEFDIGDPKISEVLKSEYGINDIRVRRLVKKAVDRVPIGGEPYPGVHVASNTLPYYLKVVADINTVDSGQEPVEWKPWIDFIVKKFQ